MVRSISEAGRRRPRAEFVKKWALAPATAAKTLTSGRWRRLYPFFHKLSGVPAYANDGNVVELGPTLRMPPDRLQNLFTEGGR